MNYRFHIKPNILTRPFTTIAISPGAASIARANRLLAETKREYDSEPATVRREMPASSKARSIVGSSVRWICGVSTSASKVDSRFTNEMRSSVDTRDSLPEEMRWERIPDRSRLRLESERSGL